jgi:2-oxo-3-hexenedioate decarboxylase
VPIDEAEAEHLADTLLAASRERTPVAPITDTRPDFDLADAYRVSAAITRKRTGRGDRQVGWKIGFTNASLWASYGIGAPIWGPMYDVTVAAAVVPGGIRCSLAGLLEPRIEPEIGFRLDRVPTPDMDEAALLECIDGVTHGFEIVQSIYPGWRTKAPDAVAGFGMHGAYRHGRFVEVPEAERKNWLRILKEFQVVLYRDGIEMERGVGSNVLGGPLSALRHFVKSLPAYPGYELNPGDIVTTGTLTKAFPAASGETWSTELIGVPLQPLKVTLS